ncbi:phage tail protein [Algoriphagus aestuarii]|nr:phage tail protein [Algoriphagus aestuarii]
MDAPFIGQIELFGFNFAPRGWAFCAGQLLPISQNDALFSLIGTIYGGDGRNTFGLPDLRGCAAIGYGTGSGLTPRVIGQRVGGENVTLTTAQMPNHNHPLYGNNSNGTTNDPSGNVIAKNTVIVERGGTAIPANGFVSGTANVETNVSSVGNVGGNQSHNNMQPSIVLNYCIALVGIYPSRN